MRVEMGWSNFPDEIDSKKVVPPEAIDYAESDKSAKKSSESDPETF